MPKNKLPITQIRKRPKTVEQCAMIALSEYVYWRDQHWSNSEARIRQIEAMGAAANIYAAITVGAMAPWHPKI